MILCVGPTPACQRVMVFDSLRIGQVNRARTTVDGVAGKSINVAKILRNLAGTPFVLGFVGGDRGEEIKRTLTERGIDFDLL